MKKFLLAVAALGMLVTSCTNDETTQGDNSSSVKFVVSTPELKTRADIIDVYGTGFTANDLEYAIYECDEQGNLKSTTPNISKEVAGAFAGNVLETTFTERLVNGKHYVILFWADAEADPYKVDWNTQSISIEDPTALKAQDENLDAFFAKVQFTVKNNMLEQTVELKRPFAQLNVGVSDTAAAATAGLEIAQTQAKVKAYTSLNLFDGSVSGQQELTYTLADAPQDVTFTDPDGNGYDIISMNYLLVNEKELNDVIFTYTDEGDTQAIPERTFSLVPVQRNHRTFIVGDLLTTAVDVKVIIIPGFDGDIIYPTDIALALTEGGLFKLQGDTTLDKSYTLSAATTIDLNGYTLTCTGSDDIMIRVADGGSLTFTGEGTVDAGNNYVASANEGGVITVESGNFTTTGTTLFQANGGEVYITGGYFTVDNEEYGTTYMLNHIDSKKNDGLIEVTGGQFVDYNPAASKSENPVMSFVPDGYAASITGTNADGESIYKVSKAVPMTGLTAAPAQVYQAATLSWDAVAGAKKYVVKYNGVQVGETDTTTITTAEGGVADAAVAKFTVEALDDNGGMVGVGETPETKIFTLLNRPEPEVRLANGRLEMATDFEWSDGYGGDWTEFGNLHENGIILAAEVYFYKDGEAMPAYTAKATSADQTGALKTYKTAFDYKYVKGSNMFMAFTQWAWAEGTGSFGGITANAPEFKPGTYTIKYNAKYIAILDGKYNNKANDGTSNPDRMHFSAALVDAVDNDINATLQKAISREGEVEAKFAVASVTPTVAPEGYQGAKVTWAAIQGATSYKVFVDGAEKANVQATEAVITGLNTKNNYSFAVKAYDQNGAVVASGDAVEAQVFSLVNTPAPVVTFVDGKLNATNLVDVTGVAMNMTVYFTKEGESTPAYTAYSEHYFNSTSDIDININTDQKFKFADFDTFTKWTWDGSTDKTKATDAAQALEPATYNITYVANYYPVVGGIWRDKDKKEVASKELAGANGRITYPSAASVLRVDTPYEGTADKLVIGFEAEAKPMVDEVILSWNPIGAGVTYEVYADGSKVGETTELTYTCAATLGDHNYEVKVAGTTVSSAVSAKVEYSIAHWTAPTFEWTGKRMKVSGLADISEAGGVGYAYGGAITNDNDTSKSTIEIYNEAGTLLYTLTNGTGQGTLTAWAGYGRWAFNAQDNRQDWVWTNHATGATTGEVDIDPTWMPAGKYTLKWTIGYVVNKNANWATTNNDSAIVGSRENGATCIYFGPKDTKPSPNVCYTDSSKTAVKIIAKSGETTLVVE